MTPAKKKARNKANAACRKRYEAKTYHKVMLRIRHDGRDGFTVEQVKRAAARSGLSVNAWLLDCIRECL